MEQNSHTVVEPQPTSSVEIKEDAKGEVRVTVKAYASDVQDAAIEALQAYYRTRQVLKLAAVGTNPAAKIIKTFELEDE